MCSLAHILLTKPSPRLDFFLGKELTVLWVLTMAPLLRCYLAEETSSFGNSKMTWRVSVIMIAKLIVTLLIRHKMTSLASTESMRRRFTRVYSLNPLAKNSISINRLEPTITFHSPYWNSAKLLIVFKHCSPLSSLPCLHIQLTKNTLIRMTKLPSSCRPSVQPSHRALVQYNVLLLLFAIWVDHDRMHVLKQFERELLYGIIN